MTPILLGHRRNAEDKLVGYLRHRIGVHRPISRCSGTYPRKTSRTGSPPSSKHRAGPRTGTATRSIESRKSLSILLVVQHCDSATAPVRNMLHAYAPQPGNLRRYMVIDSYHTIRILRRCGHVQFTAACFGARPEGHFEHVRRRAVKCRWGTSRPMFLGAAKGSILPSSSPSVSAVTLGSCEFRRFIKDCAGADHFGQAAARHLP